MQEMQRYCAEVPCPKLANMLEGGLTPILPPDQLWAMGYAVAAYPLTLLSASTRAMQTALQRLKAGSSAEDLLLPFPDLQGALGFPEYYQTVDKYST